MSFQCFAKVFMSPTFSHFITKQQISIYFRFRLIKQQTRDYKPVEQAN